MNTNIPPLIEQIFIDNGMLPARKVDEPTFFDNAYRNADGHVVAAPERTYELVSREIVRLLGKSQDILSDISHYRTTGQERQANLSFKNHGIVLDQITALEAERDAIRVECEK